MVVKLTVLYQHPSDPEKFERYYLNNHMALAAKIPHVQRAELTKFGPGPDGSKPAFYRMAEFHFASEADLMSALTHPDGKACADDLKNFADGGAHFIFGAAQVISKTAKA